jgi:transposase
MRAKARRKRITGAFSKMSSQPKTQQIKALVSRTIPKESLLDLIAEGWTLQRIADRVTEETGTKVTPYYVCKTLQSFGEEYTAAKKAQAEYHAARVSEISDKVEKGQIDPQSARVSSDNRKWLASKLDPSTYSDKAQIDIAVTDVTALHIASLRDRLKTVSNQ